MLRYGFAHGFAHGFAVVVPALLAGVVSGCGSEVTSSTGSGGSGGGSVTTSSGSTSATGSTGSTGVTSSTSTGGACSAATCAPPFVCCGALCVNPDNDIFHCGTCGTVCPGESAYCDVGKCTTAPCTTSGCKPGSVCCGAACCAAGEICCDVPGPVSMGPQCTKPENGTCPKGCPMCVCAAPDTPIATPTGERRIADLAVGDLVYTAHGEAVIAAPIARVNRAPVRDHHVVRVTLANGHVLSVSPRHPTADGRTFGDLRAGGALDGITITAAELVPYPEPFTYDILPASDSGTYFAGGARIGSTIPR